MRFNLSEFFQQHRIIDWLLGNPTEKGKISFSVIVGIVITTYFAYRIFKIVKNRSSKPTNISENVYELITSPLKGSMQISASLLQEAIRAHYRTGFSEFIKRYWLHVTGAIVISMIIYGVAVVIVVMTTGVHVNTFQQLIDGDWYKRYVIGFRFLSDNVLLNTTLLSLYVLLVIAHAKTMFLEGQFWHLRRSGIRVAFPIGEWDETPKLNVPKEELVKTANAGIVELLDDKEVDYVRLKLASGYDTIGPGGYLLDLLKRPNVHWHILLMDPDSKGAKKRADGYLSQRASDPPRFSNPEEYIESIRTTIDHLKRIKDECNHKISLKVYQHTPQWRLFIFSGKAIVSAFGPGQRSDRAPMIVFENSSTSMFHGFEEMFEDIWEHDSKNLFC